MLKYYTYNVFRTHIRFHVFQTTFQSYLRHSVRGLQVKFVNYQSFAGMNEGCNLLYF